MIFIGGLSAPSGVSSLISHLLDSNSNFRPARMNSELISGRIVKVLTPPMEDAKNCTERATLS